MSEVKLYRADWRHVVQTVEDDAQYVGINDYKNKCHSSDTYYRAWKRTELELDAQRLRADAAEAERDALRLVFENAEDCELNDAELKLSTAEQRIAELIAAGNEMLRIAAIANQGSNAYNRAIVNLHAALNPNPEAESHE